MEVWINKNKVKENKPEEYKNAAEFSIKNNENSTMYTSIGYTWKQFGIRKLNSIYEDLFIIGMSIFSIDKRISRTLFPDNWTRNLKVSIPVLELEKWNEVKDKINETLNFLTGDDWNIEFRKTEEIYVMNNGMVNKKNRINKSDFDTVSLFSGGLDSFCGAIELMKNGKSPCFIGHNEYPKLRLKQEELCELINKEYSERRCKFISFSANSRSPIYKGEKLSIIENTSRGRSFLFLCIALTIAGIIGNNVNVYIPENGFIGLNVPLTDSRKGSCSTRTTHPYFLKNMNEIISKVGINNKIINIFAYKTKREIVNLVKDSEVFNNCAKDTISCSHPCVERYNKVKERRIYPINCGYCYPCLIRKSSLLDVNNLKEEYTKSEVNLEFINDDLNKNIVSDANAVISSVYRYINIEESELYRLIRNTGKLENDEVEKFKQVYEKTMNDIIEMFSENEEMKEYIGLK